MGSGSMDAVDVAVVGAGFGGLYYPLTGEIHPRREVLTARNLLPVPWVEPADVANAAVFLASEQARYITGTQIVVDAGPTQKAT